MTNIYKVTVDGIEYEVAPMEPELHDSPSPAHPLAVTPEVAQSWLRYNYRNRHVRTAGKRDYASDMQHGRFDINGTAVTFSRPLREGEDPDVPAGKPLLIDGQHRLQSCIEAQQPFVVYVAYGIKPEARRTVDTGIKRQLADVFAMDGETNATVLAAVVKRGYFWSQGDRHLKMREESFTHADAQAFLNDHPELRRSAEIASRTHAAFLLTTGQTLRQSVAGVAHWLFMQADPTMAPEFFARLGDGAELPLNHPISVLRRRMVKDKTMRTQVGTRKDVFFVPDWQVLCYFIRSWNVYLTGPQIDGSYPEYALVGRNDQKAMPKILTAADVEARQKARVAELQQAELS
jgi:hypothetical protein